MKVGILSLQGNFREHREIFQALGVGASDIRLPEHLDDVDALVLPGGESTAISRLLKTSGLFDVIAARLAQRSLKTFGTCAGMILSARQVLDGVPEQQSFGHFDATVRRNGVGRQVASFETELTVKGIDLPVKAAFIRPPVVVDLASDVEILAEWEGSPVLCAQSGHLFATFHPEVVGETQIHKLFLERI